MNVNKKRKRLYSAITDALDIMSTHFKGLANGVPRKTEPAEASKPAKASKPVEKSKPVEIEPEYPPAEEREESDSDTDTDTDEEIGEVERARNIKLLEKLPQKVKDMEFRRRSCTLAESKNEVGTPQKEKTIRHGRPAHVVDTRDTSVMRYIPGVLTEAMLQKLDRTTDELIQRLMKAKPKDKRWYNKETGKKELRCQFSFILGTWRKSSVVPVQTADTKTKAFHEHWVWWIEENREALDALEACFLHFYPEQHHLYNSLDIGERLLGGAWPTMSLNIGAESDRHLDLGDSRHGHCWVLPFGEFTGGALVMSRGNLKMTANFGAGDGLCLLSGELEHWNMKVHGLRKALVFFGGHELFFPYLPAEERDEMIKKREETLPKKTQKKGVRYDYDSHFG